MAKDEPKVRNEVRELLDATKKRVVKCPACFGRGTIAFGPDDVECSTCGGKGKL